MFRRLESGLWTLPDVSADDIKHQVDSADVFEEAVLKVDERQPGCDPCPQAMPRLKGRFELDSRNPVL